MTDSADQRASHAGHLAVWQTHRLLLADLWGLSSWAAGQLAQGLPRPAPQPAMLGGRALWPSLLAPTLWRAHAQGALAGAARLLPHLLPHRHRWAARTLLAELPRQLAQDHRWGVRLPSGAWGQPVWACAATARAAAALASADVLPVARRAVSLADLRARLWCQGGAVPAALAEPQVDQAQLDELVADTPAQALDGLAPPHD